MYTLNLADGTSIEHLYQPKPNTFVIKSNDSSLFWKLSDSNLSFITIIDENDNLLGDMLMDYCCRNYYNTNGSIQFSIYPISERERIINKSNT